MSFRRDGKKANVWRKRLAKYPELLQKAGLPDIVLHDDHSWLFFLQEGCFQGDKNTPLIDALAFLSESQQAALYELLSSLLTEQERVGATLWTILDIRFRMLRAEKFSRSNKKRRKDEPVAHRKLFPKAGSSYLSPSEVIRRLQKHFAHVKFDLEQGQAETQAMIDQLTRMQSFTPPPATAEEIERLQNLCSQAVAVMFGDDADLEDISLTTTIIPGEPLFFGFSSTEHEEATVNLLQRCARILNYEITGE